MFPLRIFTPVIFGLAMQTSSILGRRRSLRPKIQELVYIARPKITGVKIRRGNIISILLPTKRRLSDQTSTYLVLTTTLFPCQSLQNGVFLSQTTSFERIHCCVSHGGESLVVDHYQNCHPLVALQISNSEGTQSHKLIQRDLFSLLNSFGTSATCLPVLSSRGKRRGQAQLETLWLSVGQFRISVVIRFVRIEKILEDSASLNFTLPQKYASFGTNAE